jgi:hypothetical protein
MAVFGFSSIPHFFATVFKDLHTGLKYAAEHVIPAVQKVEPLIEGVTQLIDPPAVVIERAAFTALGHLITPISTLDSAVQANGLDITLDQQTIADFYAFYLQFKDQLQALPTVAKLPLVKK